VKSTETSYLHRLARVLMPNFSNFGSLKSTETRRIPPRRNHPAPISAISAR